MGDAVDKGEDKRGPAGKGGTASGADAEASDVYGSLSFERANLESNESPSACSLDVEACANPSSPRPSADFSCQSCRAGITGEYYTLNHRALCPSCRERVVRGLAAAKGSFSRALGFGSLAAAGGAAVYYAIVAVTGYELGIIAIVVGLVVGKAVRRGAGIHAHWSYRALGIGLAWLSICATYVPPVLRSMHASAANTVALVIAFAIALVAPFLMLAEGEIMSVIILGIGLWEGWRYSAAPVVSVEGPFRLGSSPVEATETTDPRNTA